MTGRAQLIVALDVPDQERALQLVDSLGPDLDYVKIGMQLFYAAGPGVVETMLSRGLQVFLDLKLHDIPNTVYHAVAGLSGLGVEMLNVHCAGGSDMLEAAASAADGRTKVIGVTQLTSIDQLALNEELLVHGSLQDCVIHYGRLAQRAGLQGVVCSPQESAMIKREFGPEFAAVTPGVRFDEDDRGDQKRVATPARAVEWGSDYLVMGRPITQAVSPSRALQRAKRSMEVQQ